MKRKWMMSLAGGGTVVAVGVSVWMSLSGEAAWAWGSPTPAAARSPGSGAAHAAGVASPSSSVEEPSEPVSGLSDAGLAARAIADLEARGDLPVLDRTDSLTGIDADANGIRDDLDRYIDRTFGVATQREAAVKLTKTIQQTLLVDTGNHVAVMNLALRYMRDLDCFSSRFPQVGAEGPQLRTELHSLTANTKQRLLAHLRFNHALGGQTFRLSEGDGCE